ncbi:FAD binding domain-containing protein [Williamsia sp. CHRR-6]|uniref:FAD binding domain-containing protein n=1 Tax=Williamsia sp. CHRR-6 TaxID=2835871 RepID=UPI001BD95049|nr:FAD binding domain-containing protein [Williamsia sp. CHRR-6]MBT0567428.1 FAD binding domain-containing protein [Williamsia sp. CHRR-6]
MDQHFVDEVVRPQSRAELAGLTAFDGLLAGGTSLMGEPNPRLRRLVDLTALGWPDLEISAAGLTIGATCTIDRLITADYPSDWRATHLFAECANALLASYKIWYAATVGGNICAGLAAGSMISLCSALDAQLLVWRADGSDDVVSIEDVVIDAGMISLAVGDVLRSIMIPAEALIAPTELRTASYARLGRSGSLVIGRVTKSGLLISVSAATRRPYAITTDRSDPATVAAVVDAALPESAFHADAHGTPDWRRGVTRHLVAEVVTALGRHLGAHR